MQTLSLRIFAAEIFLASLTAVVGLSVFVSSPCLLAQSDKNVTTVAVPHSLGIVDEKPASGPAVEVDGKFMVPYSTTIPGTEVEIKMVPIPGGTFLMGASNGDAGDDVTPQVEVAVEPFWMGQHEVNWAQYQSYMAMDAAFKKMAKSGLRIVTSNDELDAVTAPSALYEPDITYEAGEDADQPAASMTQFAAKQFTKWLSLISGQFYRLPYEAEWEYACRAGTTTKYYFGDDDDQLDQHAWHYNVSDEQRHACGQLKPNPWGLYDMYGNVSEWVLDAYTENGYDAIAGKPTSLPKAFQKPTTVFPRVLRGGSYYSEPELCNSFSRLASKDKFWKEEDPNYPKSPWWYTGDEGLGAGMRLVRPYHNPATKAQKLAFWDADVPSIMRDAENRIDSNGRGAIAIVDPQLDEDIAAMKD
jgi:formylglycine-generating enzyme required for sulfatase activity